MKEITIIGGGISGLITGIYSQKSGNNSVILESKNQVGGFNNSFDTHIFPYGKSESRIRKEWERIDLNLTVFERTWFFKYKDITFYNELDKTKEELLKVSIDDEIAIEEFISFIALATKVSSYYSKSLEEMKFFDKLALDIKNKLKIKLFKKMANISVNDYSKKFVSEKIQETIKAFGYNCYSMYQLLYKLSRFYNGENQFVEESRTEIITKLKEKYLELGGVIKLKSDITKLDMERKTAIGIWEKKNFYNAQVIISCIDPYFLYKGLLKNLFTDRKYSVKLDEENFDIKGSFNVTLTCKNNIEEGIYYSELDHPFSISMNTKYFEYEIYKKNNRKYIGISLPQHEKDYIYWNNLSVMNSEYKKKKQNLVKRIIQSLPDSYKAVASFSSTVVDIESDYDTYLGSYGFDGISLGAPFIEYPRRVGGTNNVYVVHSSVGEMNELSALLAARDCFNIIK